MKLEKDNLTIRNAEAQDSELLCAWWNDGAVMEHAGFPKGLGTTPEKVQVQLQEDSDTTGRRHIIMYNNIPIGEMNYRCTGVATAEIGIKICDTSQQGKGFGSTLLAMFIDALFLNYGFETIVLDTNLNNTRAQHVYEKLGFRKVRIRKRAWRDQLGKMQSAVYYELKKSEWLHSEH